MITVKAFYFNDIRECTYVAYDETKECVIVDPGCQTPAEQQRLVKFIEQNGLKPVKVLLTHGHFDHVMGAAFVQRQWGIPFYLNSEDKGQLERAQPYCQMFGLNIEQPPTETMDANDGDTIKFGNAELHVIHTPGHTRGCVCYYSLPDKIIFTGDSLFAGSIGRTDLPGGDYDALMESLLGKICKLDPDMKVYPGHGPETTIAHELQTNPFLRYE